MLTAHVYTRANETGRLRERQPQSSEKALTNTGDQPLSSPRPEQKYERGFQYAWEVFPIQGLLFFVKSSRTARGFCRGERDPSACIYVLRVIAHPCCRVLSLSVGRVYTVEKRVEFARGRDGCDRFVGARLSLDAIRGAEVEQIFFGGLSLSLYRPDLSERRLLVWVLAASIDKNRALKKTRSQCTPLVRQLNASFKVLVCSITVAHSK